MRTVTVTAEPGVEGVGVVASRWALSPKLNGGWHRMVWTGPDAKYPGCSRWSSDPDAAANFGSVEELEVALATLHQRHVVAVVALGVA